ncbi:transcription factor 20-like [Mastacembelus armatus]|uniref:Transcription factor 20-like n=1 Tax=Mastacembelus armatus TaxID=205130 RepID=A0A7N8XHK2_9TELE|nr:transcription factor 20-like [Mastacembelus armatus]
MEVSSKDPSLMAMDLSKSYTPLSRSHSEAMDLAKKPEWYHRRPPSCSSDIASSYRTRASSSYNSQPGAPVHCRDMEQGSEALGDYMNSTLAPGLDLYHDGVHNNLWHPGFYRRDETGGPVLESSAGEESDSGSDVIFLVSSAKEPILCSSFIQDSVRHIVEPLSPTVSSLDEGTGCYRLPQPLSSPNTDSSYSEDSSDSSVDIPVHHARPVVLLSDLSAVYGNPAESPVDISSDDSDVIEVSVTNEKKKSHAFPCKKNILSKKRQVRESRRSESRKTSPGEVRRSTRIRKSVSEIPQFTCSASRHSLRRQVKNDAVGIYNESCESDDVMEYAVRMSSSEAEEMVSKPGVSQRVSNYSESDVDVHTERKSQEQEQKPHCKASYAKGNNHKRKKPLMICKTKKLRRTKQKHSMHHQKASSSMDVSANKRVSARRKRKRRTQTGPSALFSPREPEIKLKYANIKEGKKDKKLDSFSPFVHMEQRMCTVVNYQEEEATVWSSRGRQQQTAVRSLSGFVPKTSCFQLGRLSSESRCQTTLLCCLCAQTANAVGLGDLHGPYYPTSLSVDCQNCNAEQEEEGHENGLSNSHSVNSSNGCCDGNNQAAVRSVHESHNHSLPKVPLALDECWIHEDCGIWSAGVFLVRGRLYGLEEAAQLAQKTVCSTCQQTGAIMGCFQKGCPRNYHYRCAIQSGCVLNEENFSMRCPEHKNKQFTSATRQHKR